MTLNAGAPSDGRELVSYRYTLRTRDADDVTDGAYEDERWLRIGDEFEIDAERWEFVGRLLIPETNPDYLDAVLIVERR